MIFHNKKDLQNAGILSETSSFKDSSRTSIPLLAVALPGLVVAFLSGFHESIPFASSVCTSACTDTVRMHFLHIHFWIWGAAFYLSVAVLAVFRKRAVAWIAFAAAGVEALLILLLIWMKAPCVFCIANAAVVVVLLLAAFRKDLVWQQATLTLLFFVAFLFWVPFENNLPYLASANSAPGRYDYGTAASVGGETITNQRLDVLVGRRLQQLRTEIYRMKMQRLDQLIVNTIMDKEAKREGKTLDQLVAAVTGSVSVSDADVAQYMQEHQQQLQSYENTVPDLKQRIRRGLEKQKREQAVENYAHSLEPRYHVRFFLPVPYPPKVKIDVSGAPALGPKNAPVTVVEFSDYQCPACRANHPVVEQVRAAFGDKLRWVHMDYPLHIHK
ncbi:MAG: thioredoxin domain-containing protein, partial [Syntrophobacteraceae bacterium]